MNVTIVKWEEIPRKDWDNVLETIPIGGYVNPFPYTVEHVSIYIPYLRRLLHDISEIWDMDELYEPKFNYMKFTKTTIKGDIYKRVN